VTPKLNSIKNITSYCVSSSYLCVFHGFLVAGIPRGSPLIQITLYCIWLTIWYFHPMYSNWILRSLSAVFNRFWTDASGKTHLFSLPLPISLVFRVMGRQIIAVLSEVCETGDNIALLISWKRGVVCSSLNVMFWSSGRP